MKANSDFDDTNDFDDAFMNDQAVDTVQVEPEEVVHTESSKAKKSTGLLRYLMYGAGGLIVLFIVLVIWATISAESSEPAGQQSVAQETASQDVATAPAAPVSETLPENVDPGNEAVDIEVLKSQLKAARENTAIRDTKYKELASAYVQLQADYKLLKGNQKNTSAGTSVEKPEYKALPVMKGISLVSVYDGYAFIKKGSTVYSIKKGDKVNNANVIDIDPVFRKVITAKGVIE